MLIVTWQEQVEATEKCVEINLQFATLVIYYSEQLIIGTEWQVGQTKNRVVVDEQCKKIQQYLMTPDRELVLTLCKQGTVFRHKVWVEICKIPVGEVRSYSQLANTLGSGARAIANACRNNPFPGIIPCHRVVAVSGVGGFMGERQGKYIDIKKNLLAHERLYHSL